MCKISRVRILGLATLTAVLYLPLSTSEAAITSATYHGCFVCDSIGLVGVAAECDQVGENEPGEGDTCKETTGLVGGTLCQLSGNSCYNIIVHGGSGGTPVGPSTCAYDDNGYCAPWCSACSMV